MASVQPSIAHRLVALALVPVLIGGFVAGWYGITAGPFDLSIFGFISMIVAMPLILLTVFIAAPLVVLTRHQTVRLMPAAFAGALIVSLSAALLMIRADPIDGLRDGFYEMLSIHHPRGTPAWTAEIASEVLTLAAVGLASGVIFWVLCGRPWHRAHRDR